MGGPTVIVGAGPAGLAVAAALGQGGVPYEVLEQADSVGSAWRSRYDSLTLHTVRWLSGLPGAPIPRNAGPWVRRDDLVAYLEDYARRFHVEPTLGTRLLRVDREQDGWRLETSHGTRHAAQLVLATGHSATPWIPDWPGRESFTPRLLHSAGYREPSGYRGNRVLVVGAGNSAAEIAVELGGVAEEVLLAVRTPPNIVPRATLGVPSQLLGIALRGVPEPVMNRVTALLRRWTVPDLTDLGLPSPPGDGFTQFLRSASVPILDHGFVDAVRRGAITVVPSVASLHQDEVHLVDGRVLRPDAVIAATGYRRGLEPLVGHLGVLDEQGTPRVHGARTLAEAPGLYFVGITVELAGLLREIGREARAVADVIVREQGPRRTRAARGRRPHVRSAR
jgi:putative flavoprotein involved in K+ transport